MRSNAKPNKPSDPQSETPQTISEGSNERVTAQNLPMAAEAHLPDGVVEPVCASWRRQSSRSAWAVQRRAGWLRQRPGSRIREAAGHHEVGGGGEEGKLAAEVVKSGGGRGRGSAARGYAPSARHVDGPVGGGGSRQSARRGRKHRDFLKRAE